MSNGKPWILVVLAVLFFVTAAHAADEAQKTGIVRLDHATAVRIFFHGIDVRVGEARLRIVALRDDVLRVRVAPNSQLPEDASWAVLPAARTATTEVAPEITADSVGFRTAKLRVTVHRTTLALRVSDLDGHVLMESFPVRPIEYHGASFRVYMHSPEDEHYFGLGDKPGPLDRRNAAFANWNTDSFGWQESTDPIYKSIPFFLTYRKGISTGIFLDNTWRTSFDFNKEYRDAYAFGAEGGPLDLYLLYGPEPKKVLTSWAWLSGHTPLPPLWSLGFQQSRYSYYPESEVRRIADRLRSERIPADVIWLDIDYQQKNRPFTIDPERFPHFDQMIQDLKAQHLRTVVITDLHIADLPGAGYKPYDEGNAHGYFVKNPDGSNFVGTVWPGKAVFPDFTRQTVRDWWGTLYADFIRKNIAGFWNDMNEPSVFDAPSKTMPDNVEHRIEEPGFATRTASHLEVHNIFGMQNSRATYEGLLKLAPDARPFVMTRASYAGGQRYAATWTGDNASTWNHLRQSIPQLLNLGLSGFAMSGADVGGFAGSPQPDLLTRWLEVAAFEPIDRDHSALGTHPQEPWENGTPADVNLRRRYIEERYRLLPYLYTAAEEMSRTGLPIMRPLFLEFPQTNEPLDFGAGNAFLLGADLLVAESPQPDELDDYTVALPPAGWYNYWTGERIAKTTGSATSKGAADKSALQPTELHLHRALDVLPVFVRSGSIIPIQPLVESTNERPAGPLTLRVYPPMSAGEDCRGSLYLDDGVSFAYTTGKLLRREFTCQVTPNGIAVRISPEQGSFAPWWKQLSIEIYGATRAAASVRMLPLDDSETVSITSVYDAEHHRITAFAPDLEKGLEVQLTY